MHPGLLELHDGNIRYRIDGETVWELPVSSIRVVGEATNDSGPFLDDYFFCFATDADTWYEASFYANGRDEFLKAFAAIVECELALKLMASTDFESNVLWPPHLAGGRMFLYKPALPTTWIGRLVGRFTGAWRNTQWFSDEVLAELRAEGRTKRYT